MTRFLLAAAVALVAAGGALAESPRAVTAITPYPAAFKLKGMEDAPQLLVTGKTADGREIDLSAAATYAVSDPKVARVDPTGRVFPVANGAAEITVSYEGKTVRVPLTAEKMEAPQPLNFPNHVVPILTKLSCSSGGCHGKIAGQNGFRLSLLGFDPAFDYENLLKEARGRRVFPAAPESSLLLTKMAGVAAHGGGKKTEVGSEEYKLIRRWIASGMPYGSPSDPTVTKISVVPESRVVDRKGRQQVAVYAHFSDGSVEDVTRRAQYESNDTDIASVSDTGVVATQSMTGQAAVMARFNGHVAVFRATVPRPGDVVKFTFPEQTVVDKATANKWRELNITPSELCTDEVFIRRVYLDVTGTLPSAAEVTAFLADKDPKKRDALVDKLLDSPEYAYFFANKWADILRVKRRNQADRAYGTFAFHTWIREAVAADKPYDAFVRDIVCAIGDESKSPATVWYKEVKTPEQFVDDVSQVFLGQRLACANCHHHPYEKWSQDDYWGVAAFFGRVGTKTVPVPGRVQQNNQNQRQVLFVKSAGNVTNKRTGQTAPMKPLDADPMTSGSDEDPRQKFADWMTGPTNPFFAKAVANRYWAHFFGRGIVDPLDDMRITNPPSNPELLDALAKNLVDNKYSLKALVKTICKSRTYQLAALPNEQNAADKQSFARYYPKRLQAEVLFDAVCKLTDSPTVFPGLPSDRFAPSRAIMLPDESFVSYFLDVTGRPQRISACECERVNEASLAMTLHLLNSQEVQDKIARAGARADQITKDPRPDAEKVTELFLVALGTKPSEEKLKLALEHIEKHKAAKTTKLAYENIIWALLNSKGFLFNQ
ncbi:Ig-like domain-containing protein OS=Singulisphaera acidiphila (strain ATCC BAA-1392 / DSM 18658 / VKM B-2454 / MOB10) GN=Sinac_3078 PE=4 SV=1: Big_2: Big_2: PSCyt2: PSD1 [Gemmataceae bacterium]|nr:Ig-like domain-containing protein OS=Singulisphaera acidiphila (strain ATCC BAA-1392 / DSM 18658 / VKM B-2454 / MOB10) GN=Sinac_3078 PE=4 SV=1: Big_2: Big_2: PSCyt2: PSD1 [Gemmataceae bacterium]VTT98308.1 Ig-like domain-containing protein OS=Singulisphaera acidiphila (strain ATCC BAA-1392 / DSM 18658 / VKM B-2454 / MOB10) GN=Sinac_3078 PE=4 SV=1: Big_2: Big_2: PSCyt2: PSD1 [Gemmataceae bacterium]